MTKRMLQRGFTLIELLVVIAIIGILAATVLASLGTARKSGEDAKIKGQLSSMRAEAELTYTNKSNSYATVCTDTAKFRTNITGAQCFDTDIDWIATAPLTASTTEVWCVDSTGASKARAAGSATADGQTCG